MAALSLAADLGWEQVTLRDIAQGAGVSLPDLYDHFEDKTDILTALGRMIDRAVLARAGVGEDSTSPRDRLFEIVMERFDVLNGHRAGIVAILSSFRLDPKQAVISLPHLCRSMAWMMEAAGVDTGGVRGAARLAGLTGVYLYAVKAWMEDESADMGKTMAALDKALGRAERAATILGL